MFSKVQIMHCHFAALEFVGTVWSKSVTRLMRGRPLLTTFWLFTLEYELFVYFLDEPCLGDGLRLLNATSKLFLSVLQALQIGVVSGFFNVHLVHDQNSPLRRVMSLGEDNERSLEPQQASQIKERPLFTRVHFLQVHFWSSTGLSSPGRSWKSSSRSCSSVARGTWSSTESFQFKGLETGNYHDGSFVVSI